MVFSRPICCLPIAAETFLASIRTIYRTSTTRKMYISIAQLRILKVKYIISLLGGRKLAHCIQKAYYTPEQSLTEKPREKKLCYHSLISSGTEPQGFAWIIGVDASYQYPTHESDAGLGWRLGIKVVKSEIILQFTWLAQDWDHHMWWWLLVVGRKRKHSKGGQGIKWSIQNG